MTNPMPTSPPAMTTAGPACCWLMMQPTNLHVLRQILGDDYRLQFATMPGAAAGAATAPGPDPLGIMMPQLNGYHVCRQLKARPETRAPR